MTKEEKTAWLRRGFEITAGFISEELYAVSEDGILYEITCVADTIEGEQDLRYEVQVRRFAPKEWPITEASLTKWDNFDPPGTIYIHPVEIQNMDGAIAWLENEYLGENWHILQKNTAEINNLLAGLRIKSYDCPVCDGGHTITGVETFCHEYTGYCSNCKAQLHYTRIVPNYNEEIRAEQHKDI